VWLRLAADLIDHTSLHAIDRAYNAEVARRVQAGQNVQVKLPFAPWSRTLLASWPV
jgi:hypothetical protein